jgi:hypothetical protein
MNSLFILLMFVLLVFKKIKVDCILIYHCNFSLCIFNF